MPYTDKKFDAFRRQRMECRNRGIEFHFTFEEWVSWWESYLGADWLAKRGTKRHQYVMARKGDKGDYRASNVECITASKNMTDSNHNAPRGGGPIFLGRKHRPESIEKMSHAASGKGNPFYGRTHSEETRAKMRAAKERIV